MAVFTNKPTISAVLRAFSPASLAIQGDLGNQRVCWGMSGPPYLSALACSLGEMQGRRIEQRPRLRAEEPPATATVVVRGGRDTPEKLRSHVQRTARAWSLDGQPLLGISVFAVLGEPLDDLLRRRFATFRTIYLATVGGLADRGFELLPTGQRPHYTVRLRGAGDQELGELLGALGAVQRNPAYAGREL